MTSQEYHQLIFEKVEEIHKVVIGDAEVPGLKTDMAVMRNDVESLKEDRRAVRKAVFSAVAAVCAAFVAAIKAVFS